MPLPFIIGGLAAVAAVGGIGSGIHGGVKMKEANDTMKLAKRKQEVAIENFKKCNERTTARMDRIGNKELSILDSFGKFSDLIEKIQGRPEFKSYTKDGVELPKYKAEELKKASVGAGVLMGGLGGAAAGTAGGFAAAGATTSAVMALGTASTGTAISTLSGAAATNATLAALGGGAVGTSATAGGMALGSAVLGGATLGVGLLVGGVIFNITGSKLSNKADEAYAQAKKTEQEVNKIISYLDTLDKTADIFEKDLNKVNEEYEKRLKALDHVVNLSGKVKWSDFTDKEKLMTENLVMLVGLLYKMCQIKLVLKSDNENEPNIVNSKEIEKNRQDTASVMQELDDVA